MRTYLNKSLSLLLCAALLVALAGCSSKPQQEQQSALTETESAAPNSEEAASTSQLIDDFAEVWATKWNELADDVVMSEPMGRAFLADLDSDGADELVFLYDDYLRYQGIVYRLGDSIEELGSFSVSNPSPELEFSIYQNGQGTVLYHKAVITHAGEMGTETEESFIRLEDGAVVQDGLYSTNANGTETYLDGMQAGANELTREDYELLRIGMLGSSTPSRTIRFEAEGDFSFNASVYTQEELAGKRHNFELEQCKSNVICVDSAMAGVGSNSCGPELREKYRIPLPNVSMNIRMFIK